MEGLVLAGGQSTRYGSDKALADFRGKTLIEHAAERLGAVVPTVTISAGPATAARHYIDGLRHVYDAPGFKGPLAGIHAGLKAMTSEWLLVLAVDLPYVQIADLQRLIKAAEQGGAIIHAVEGADSQPLCGLYHRTIRRTLTQALSRRERTVHKLLLRVDTRSIAFPTGSLVNVNEKEA